ncbi:MAG: hypothetical protein ABL888_11215 [Pirellulaceae bacterium]
MKTRIRSTFALMLCALLILPINSADAQAFQPGKHLNRSAKADLKIQTFQQAGQPAIRNGKLEVPFQMTIKNIGAAASIDNVVNGIRVSSVYQWSGFMSAIAPNGSKVISGVLKMNPPDQALPNRELHLIAMADAPIAGADTSIPEWGRVNESDESNNTKALGVKIPSSFGVTSTPAGNAASNGSGAISGSTKTAPGVGGGGAGPMDLVVEQFEVEGQVQYSDGNIEIPVRIKVRNLGSLPSPANVVNGVEFGNKFIWSGMMDSVPANSFRVATGVVKIPDPGQLKKGQTLKLTAMADAPIAAADTSIADWGRVQEGNESNNRRELSVKVPGSSYIKSK